MSLVKTHLETANIHIQLPNEPSVPSFLIPKHNAGKHLPVQPALLLNITRSNPVPLNLLHGNPDNPQDPTAKLLHNRLQITKATATLKLLQLPHGVQNYVFGWVDLWANLEGIEEDTGWVGED
jgi:hypothetical protein